MLVLSRKMHEACVVGASDGWEPMLKVTVLEIEGGRVKLGFEAERNVRIHRWEVWEKMTANGELLGSTSGPLLLAG